MYDFFHGVNGEGPSQIKMVAEGTSVYKDLYETTVKPIVNKRVKKGTKQGASVKRKRLKVVLTRQERTHYYSGTDITHTDLEKKST